MHKTLFTTFQQNHHLQHAILQIYRVVKIKKKTVIEAVLLKISCDHEKSFSTKRQFDTNSHQTYNCRQLLSVVHETMH